MERLKSAVIGELTDPGLALCRKDKGRAAELKGRGNACFSRREFDQALGFYSQALRYVPISSDGTDDILVPALCVNRASTMHKLGLLEECLRDCDRAISISPTYAKAWYRRGMVNASLKNYSSARHDLEVALSMEVTSSGKSNIEQELKLILLKPQCIILKSCRETYCHYCFSEAPADVVFCPCVQYQFIVRKCQEEAVGGVSWNQDTYLESNSNAVDLGTLSLTSTGCKAANSKQIAEHRHECGGAHWAAVLPADIVLAGRLMAQYIDNRMLTGKSSAISGPNLDLIQHYDVDSPTSKLESHIYAIVLLLCLQKYYRSDLSWKEETLSQLVLLICQVKVNSIAIVCMKSMDGGQGLTENKGYSAADDGVMCSVEQVKVAQAIYMSGSPIELSYGPQAGEMNLVKRQQSLQENYKFTCQCSSCSELHLSDLVVDSFCCPQSNCLGAVSESTCYKSEENCVHVSVDESDVCKLSLPHVSKVDEDIEKIGKLFFRNNVDLKINPGYCMSCRSQINLSSAVATSEKAASKINRFKELAVINKISEIPITSALQSYNR
ncbi:hypothetical protein ZWY2020_042272 [Hordeum vulgare]|nr:hypothetical protein ZWY2020_042272 [Hordeum vulgare]